MLELSQNPEGNGCQAKHPLYTPDISSTSHIVYDQKLPNYLPKRCLQNTPENAFMYEYFYFYCVVKCGNRALGINERIKKSSQTQKCTQTHHCHEVIEGPGTPRKMFESVIFGTFFLKMSVVRFLELIAKIRIAKIGIAKIGIAKIGIPIGMDH
jgi:hypothetical protein